MKRFIQTVGVLIVAGVCLLLTVGSRAQRAPVPPRPAAPREPAAPRPAPANPAAMPAPAPAVQVGAGEEALTAQDRQMREWAHEASARITRVMEKWIREKKVTEKQLFAYLYYPIAKTDPVKFSTEYDKLSDQEIGPIQEEYLAKASELVFVVTVDRNGYLPTHNLRYTKPLTGHLSVDLVGNRTKRIFNDRTGFAAARNLSPYLLQVYKRDTGEIMKDLSVPVYVNGKAWGGLRFGYRPK